VCSCCEGCHFIKANALKQLSATSANALKQLYARKQLSAIFLQATFRQLSASLRIIVADVSLQIRLGGSTALHLAVEKSHFNVVQVSGIPLAGIPRVLLVA